MQDLPDSSQEHIEAQVMGGTGLQIMQQSVRLFFLERKLSAGVLEKLNKKICPKCGSEKFSLILQGNKSPCTSFWECSDCSFQCNQADKIDSFDFDQGFNLDEVYDQ